MKRLYSMGVIIIFLLALVAVWQSPASASEEKDARIGVLAPLSGAAAAWGIPMQRAAETFAEDVNRAGGFKVGNSTYKLKVTAYDHKYDASEAVSASRKAAHDGSMMVIGVGGGVTPAIQSITEPANIINMAIAGGGCGIVNPDNPLTFQTFVSTGALVTKLSDEYIGFFKPKKIAILQPDDSLGRGHGEYFKEYLTKKYPNIALVTEEYYPRSTTDFYPVLGRILDKKTDFLFTINSAQATVALIAKQSRELGFKGPIIAGTDVIPSKMIKIAGAASLDFVTGRHYLKAPTKMYSQLNDLQRKKYKEDPSDSFQIGYGSIDVWLKSVVKAGTFEAQKVANTMQDMTYPDFVKGPARWRDFGCGVKRQLEYPIEMAIFQKGKIYDWFEWKKMKE